MNPAWRRPSCWRAHERAVACVSSIAASVACAFSRNASPAAGDRHAAWMALEQLDPDLRLEPGHGLRERGLGQLEPLGGARHLALPAPPPRSSAAA